MADVVDLGTDPDGPTIRGLVTLALAELAAELAADGMIGVGRTIGLVSWPELVDRKGRTLGAAIRIYVRRWRWSAVRRESIEVAPYVELEVHATRRGMTYGARPPGKDVGLLAGSATADKAAAEAVRRLQETRRRYQRKLERGEGL